MESISFDRIWVWVTEVGNPTNTRVVWHSNNATMTNTVGSPSRQLPASAGWGRYSANISAFAGLNIQVTFHMETDTSVNFAGWAIDDVSIRGTGGVSPTPTPSASPTPSPPLHRRLRLHLRQVHQPAQVRQPARPSARTSSSMVVSRLAAFPIPSGIRRPRRTLARRCVMCLPAVPAAALLRRARVPSGFGWVASRPPRRRP